MAELKQLKDYEEALLASITENNPSGEFLYYDEIYQKIQEHARADDTLPKGVWSFEEKLSDWKKVHVLCLDVLTKRSKDVQVASWLTQSLMHQHHLQGLYEGLETLRRLCMSFWRTIHPLMEDGDEEFRCSALVWLNAKLAPKIRALPLFYSIQTMEYTLPIYYYNMTQINHGKGQETKASMAQQWKDGALAAPGDDIAVAEELTHAIDNTLHSFSDWLDTKLSQEKISFHQFHAEMENIRDGLAYMKVIRQQAQEKKSKESEKTLEEKAEELPKPRPAPEEPPLPPQPEETPEEPATPQLQPEPVSTPVPVPEPTVTPAAIPLTRTEVYGQLHKLVNTLQSVDPQSPIAMLLSKILAYEGLSFHEMIAKYDKKGTLRRVQELLDQDQEKK